MIPISKHRSQLIQRAVEARLQIVQDVGRVALQLRTAHCFEHLLQLNSKLLDVVHEDASLLMNS